MWPEPARIWGPAVVVALIVTALVGGVAFLMLNTALHRSTPVLEQSTQAGAEAVGRSVAAQFSRALELGIPLDKLQGVEAYLRRIVERSPQVRGLALLDANGRMIGATAEGITGPHFPISGGGSSATLVIATESFLINHTVNELKITLAVAALLTGIVTGGIVAFFLALRQNPARAQFAQALGQIAKGNFSARLPHEGRGSLVQAARALSQCIDKVDRARRRLAEAVATVRAIDFDGSLGRRVDRIVTPVESRYVFSGAAQGDEPGWAADTRRIAALWRAALILGLYASAFPLVANFAIDRESVVVPLAWSPVLPILAELGAGALGVLIGRSRLGGSTTGLAVGCIIMGLCLGATYWCRDYDDFVLLRAGGGFAIGLVTAGLLGGGPLDRLPPHVFHVLVFSVLLAAPIFGGLLTESPGRRGGFFVLGAAVLLITPLIVSGGRQLSRPSEPPRAGSFSKSDSLFALAVLPVAALVLVEIPAGFGLENYLPGAAPIALLAAVALLVPALPPLLCGIALLAAAALLALLPETILSLSLACAAIGAGSGGLIKSVWSGINRPWIALGLALGAALIAAGASASFHAPFGTIAACVAVAVMAVQFVWWPRTVVQAT